MKTRGESDDGDMKMALPSMSRPINHYVDELYKKGGSKREDALASIIRILSTRMQTKFVDDNFATLLYLFLNSMKKGSANERELASNALGLLAMTTGCRDKAHELYDESTPVLFKALNSSFNASKVLDSLAIVSFFCAENSDEMEKIMQIIWGNIHQKSGSTGTENSDRKMGLISAWSFLLSTLDGWKLSCKYWKGAISYFSSLLEDEVFHSVASEALNLIHETGSPDKFYGDLVTSRIEEVKDSATSSNNDSSTKGSVEAAEEIVTSSESCSELDVSKYFQPQDITGKSVKIGKQKIIFSSHAQMVQLSFIKRYLGSEGFNLHMRENEIVQDVFEFKMNKEHHSGPELYVSEREKLIKRYLVPGGISSASGDEMLPFISSKNKGILQRMTKSSNSPRSKARTQLMNKKRMQSEERNIGHFVSGD